MKCSTESHVFIFYNAQNNLNEMLVALTGLDLSFIRNIRLFKKITIKLKLESPS